MSLRRKVLLAGLFCLHLLTVVFAVYKVPQIVAEHGDQTTRTMWASAEILVATFAANALTIGTFVRDTGLKKRKNRYRPETRSGPRSGRRESRMGKDSWLEVDSDGEGVARRTTLGVRQGICDAKPNATASSAHGVMGRTESVDSLIPRNGSDTSTVEGNDGVLKTTTVEVSSTPASRTPSGHLKGYPGGLLLRPMDGVVTASARARQGRGLSIPLKQLSPLPDHGKAI
jgi:hypothetical protein